MLDPVHIRSLCLQQYRPLCWMLYTSDLCVLHQRQIRLLHWILYASILCDCVEYSSDLCISREHNSELFVCVEYSPVCQILYISVLCVCVEYSSDLCAGRVIRQTFALDISNFCISILYTSGFCTGSLLGDSGGVVNSFEFCPASLKSLGCFYFRCVLSSQEGVDSEFANFTLPTLKTFSEARSHNVSGNNNLLLVL